MSWMLRPALGGVAAGGGAARIMSPLPSRPAPQGHTRWWVALGGAGGIFPTAETPQGTSADGLWLGSLSVGAVRCGLLVNGDPHPQRRLVCARVCELGVCVGVRCRPHQS